MQGGSGGGSAAGGTSLAALGFQVAGDIFKGYGQQQTDEYKASLLEEQAQFGTVKATEVSGQLTQRLNQTLGNIDTIRAAAHTDITSPTGAAVRGEAESTGLNQIGIEQASAEEQARLQEQEAAFLRYSGNQAMLGSYLQAGGAIIGAGAQAATSPTSSFSLNIPGVTG